VIHETAVRHLRGLVLEGVPCVGKSSVIRAVLSSGALARRPSVSLMVLGEHITQRAVESREHAGTITAADNVALLQHTLSMLDAQHQLLASGAWRCGVESHELAFVLDRFHLTHVLHYPHVGWADVDAVDERLGAVGTRLAVLVMDESVMPQRILRARGEGWRAYISQFGTEEEIVAHYAEQQVGFLQLAERSRLPSLVLDATEADWGGLAEQLYAFWEP